MSTHPVGATVGDLSILHVREIPEGGKEAYWELRKLQQARNIQTWHEWVTAVRTRFGNAGIVWCNEHTSGAPQRFTSTGSSGPEADELGSQFFNDVFPGQGCAYLGSSRSCWLVAAWWLWNHPELLSAPTALEPQ